MEIPEGVRHLALRPFEALPRPPEVEHVEIDGATVAFTPWPSAQLVFPQGEGPSDVSSAVEAARAAARERGKSILGWWIPTEHARLVPELEAMGLVNKDTPGFEAVENTMALVEPPAGSATRGVDVALVETWEEYLETGDVIRAVFGFPELTEAELRQRWEESLAGRERGRGMYAAIDGKIVASGYAAFGAAGVNLFGGAVLPEARGRGVYRSLVHARWHMAVERGTPALTVQAGRMSRPICERLGFQLVEPVRVFVDETF